MACHNCNKCCSCEKKNSECVRYNGKDLPIIGVKKGDSLEKVLCNIEEYLISVCTGGVNTGFRLPDLDGIPNLPESPGDYYLDYRTVNNEYNWVLVDDTNGDTIQNFSISQSGIDPFPFILTITTDQNTFNVTLPNFALSDDISVVYHSLTEDVTTKSGEMYLIYGDLDLNGNTLTNNGKVVIIDGELNLGGGSIVGTPVELVSTTKVLNFQIPTPLTINSIAHNLDTEKVLIQVFENKIQIGAERIEIIDNNTVEIEFGSVLPTGTIEVKITGQK